MTDRVRAVRERLLMSEIESTDIYVSESAHRGSLIVSNTDRSFGWIWPRSNGWGTSNTLENWAFDKPHHISATKVTALLRLRAVRTALKRARRSRRV